MISCQFRLISIDEPDQDGETALAESEALSVTEGGLQDALLDALAPFGLVSEAKLLRFSARSASFNVRMARESEAFRAAERLTGKSLSLPNTSTLAVLKATYGGPRTNRCQAVFRALDPKVTQEDLLKLLRRRFLSCGTIQRIDLSTTSKGSPSYLIVFEEVFSALRAVEDFRERGSLPGEAMVQLMSDEEKDADKKRLRAPSDDPQKVEAKAFSTRERDANSDLAGTKRTREGGNSTAGVRNSMTASPGGSKGTFPKDAKRSREAGVAPLKRATSDESATTVGGSSLVANLDDELIDRHTPTPGLANEDSTLSLDLSNQGGTPHPPNAIGMTASDPAAFLKAAQEGRQLFVVHSKTVEMDEVAALFEDKLGFETIEIKRARKSGLRGMTFVTFSSHEHAKAALEELHGKEFPAGSETKLKVMFAEAWDESKRPVSGETRSRATTPVNANGSTPVTSSTTPSASHDGSVRESGADDSNFTPKVKDEERTPTTNPSSRSHNKRGSSTDRHQPSTRSSAFSSYNQGNVPAFNASPYYPSPQHHSLPAEVQLEQELAARQMASTDDLAETFGNVMGFVPSGPPAPQWMMQPAPMHGAGYPLHPSMYYGPSGFSPGYYPSVPQEFMHHPAQPHPSMFVPQQQQYRQTSSMQVASSLANLPDASRLHVVFGKPLPEDVVQHAFESAAPGLQYVSKHTNKPYAFVKYATSASAMLAMVRLHGSSLMGQKLRVTLADPPPADSATRKRQKHPSEATLEEEEEDRIHDDSAVSDSGS